MFAFDILRYKYRVYKGTALLMRSVDQPTEPMRGHSRERAAVDADDGAVPSAVPAVSVGRGLDTHPQPQRKRGLSGERAQPNS